MITQDPIYIFSAAVANGIGTPRHVADLDQIMLALNTSGTTTATIKFMGSYAKERPDFSAAQSQANQWDYVRVVDLEDGSAIAGDTGVALAGADNNLNLEVDVNGLNWICAIISGYSAGSINLDMIGKIAD